MSRKARRAVLFAVKGVIAAALLTWVLAQVHWRDYVQARRTGETFSILARLPAEGGSGPRLRVARGLLWWREETLRPLEDFEPLPSSRQVARPGFLSSLREMNVPLAAVASLGFGLSLVLVAGRWWLLLGTQGIRIGYWEAVRLTFLGQFFNAVVPGTVGGDLVKAYYVSKHTPKKAAALLSVFVDRLTGLVGLALMAAGMLLVVLVTGRETFEDMRLPATSVGIILLGLAGVLTFLLSARFRRVLRLERLYRRLPIAHHIAAAADAAALYRRRPGALGKAIGMTLAAQLAFVGFVALTGVSLSIRTPVYSYFVYVPLIYIIGAIPLTPGGVGWVENWYVKLFQSAVCGASPILVLAMVARLVPILWGLPGAAVAVTGARPPKTESIEAELGIRGRQGE